MKKLLLMLAFLLLLPLEANSQRKRNQKDNSKYQQVSLNAFKFRNIGPGFLSGRIADIAIHPENENTWYVAAGSGGVWMSDNAGTVSTSVLGPISNEKFIMKSLFILRYESRKFD